MILRNRSIGFALLAVLASAAGAVGQQSANAPAGCYSFLRGNRIWVTCNGKAQPVSHKRHWVAYAVGPEGKHLAVRGGPWALRSRQHDFEHKVLVLSLPNGATTWRSAASYFIPTCGTIAVIGFRHLTDLITGQPLHSQAYGGLFRCDDQRSITIGAKAVPNVPPANGAERYTLWLGEPPVKFLCPFLSRYFAVSPGGSYLTWLASPVLGNPYLICVQRPQDMSPTCVGHPIGDDLFTVSDEGEVLWDAEPDDQPPEVSAVYYWRPDLAESVMLQMHASQPEWITPAAAKALVDGYRANRWPMF